MRLVVIRSGLQIHNTMPFPLTIAIDGFPGIPPSSSFAHIEEYDPDYTAGGAQGAKQVIHHYDHSFVTPVSQSFHFLAHIPPFPPPLTPITGLQLGGAPYPCTLILTIPPPPLHTSFPIPPTPPPTLILSPPHSPTPPLTPPPSELQLVPLHSGLHRPRGRVLRPNLRQHTRGGYLRPPPAAGQR